jgi:hypothetical protein
VTILGGIIGYQSGELAAGLAIGAALQFGGGIVDGVGGLLTDKETRFEQKVSLDSENGRICLARSDFSPERVEKLVRRLGKKFQENGWSYTPVQKKKRAGCSTLSEKWQCVDAGGGEFELNFSRERCRDTQILIGSVDKGTLSRGEITIEVYRLFREAALAAD